MVISSCLEYCISSSDVISWSCFGPRARETRSFRELRDGGATALQAFAPSIYCPGTPVLLSRTSRSRRERPGPSGAAHAEIPGRRSGKRAQGWGGFLAKKPKTKQSGARHESKRALINIKWSTAYLTCFRGRAISVVSEARGLPKKSAIGARESMRLCKQKREQRRKERTEDAEDAHAAGGRGARQIAQRESRAAAGGVRKVVQRGREGKEGGKGDVRAGSSQEAGMQRGRDYLGPGDGGGEQPSTRLVLPQKEPATRAPRARTAPSPRPRRPPRPGARRGRRPGCSSEPRVHRRPPWRELCRP